MTRHKLGDLAKITVGHVGPMAAEYVPTGIPFLRSLNVRPFRIELDGVKFITPAFHAKLQKSALRPGDVVVVRTGSPGTAAVVPPTLLDSNCSDLVIIRPGAQLDARYLAYYINGAASGFVASRLVGAVQQHFNVASARELPIPALSLDEQRSISGFLGALDDLIDVNESAARKIQELLDATWDTLTPAVERAVQVGEIATVVLGGTPSRSNSAYWGGTIPWINSGKANDFRVLSASELITTAGLDGSSAKLMPRGTTVIAITGATLGQVSRLEMAACGNQSLVGVYSSDQAINDALYFAIRRALPVLVRSATGGAQQHINKGNVEQLPVAIPEAGTLARWHADAAPLLESIAELLREAEELREARAAVLPGLLSGVILVSRARGDHDSDGV